MHPTRASDERPLGTRSAALGFIHRRVTLRPPHERRIWTVLAVIGTLGFVITLSIATTIAVALGRGMAGWQWASFGFVIAAGYSTVRMYQWPVEIRRPLLFTILECASWVVLLWIGLMSLLTAISVVIWSRAAPAGIPVIGFEQVPRVITIASAAVCTVIVAVALQRYSCRQLRIVMGRCTRCEYRLVGLTAPRCPECGTPFDPSKISHIDAGAV